MNRAEIQALCWLSKTTGYKEDEISFANNRSPDFTTPDGKGFEVKSLYGKRIVLDSRQWVNLYQHLDCVILVFADSSEPYAIIPLREIPPGVREWHDLKITIVRYNSGSISRIDYLAQIARKADEVKMEGKEVRT